MQYEQSPSKTLAASASPPSRKKRGRPKKAEKMLSVQSVDAATKVRRRKRPKKLGGLAKSGPLVVASGSRKKRPTSASTTKTSGNEEEEAGGGPLPVQVAEESRRGGSNANHVGQHVYGVVDGMFDAGYLVTVRVGEKESVFRGVVFGPGLSLTLNTRNDVAPNIRSSANAQHNVDVNAPTAISSGAATDSYSPSSRGAVAEQRAPASILAPKPHDEGPAHIRYNSTLPLAGAVLHVEGLADPTSLTAPASAGYNSQGAGTVAYVRSPLFVESQCQLHNASVGGASYSVHAPNAGAASHLGAAPTYLPGPTNPAAFPGGAYTFQYPPTSSPHFNEGGGAASAAAAVESISTSPTMQAWQGTLPPRP